MSEQNVSPSLSCEVENASESGFKYSTVLFKWPRKKKGCPSCNGSDAGLEIKKSLSRQW